MGEPCIVNFKKAFPGVAKTLEEKAGAYNINEKGGGEAWVKAIKETIAENETNLKTIYQNLGINETTKEPVKSDKPIPAKESSQPEKGTPETPPPAEPPTGEGEVAEKESGGKKKGVLTHLYEAKNVPQAAREGFKKEGLEYQTSNQEEAEAVAKSVIDEYGIDEALRMANEEQFDGDVNAMIFGESLNRLAEQEEKATTSEEKFNLANKFADTGIILDEKARKKGRFNAAIGYFYKKSPLGMVLKQNKQNKKDFDKWAKGKDESWDDFLGRLNEQPEFKEYISKEVQSELKKERAEARKDRIKKVDDTIDGWIKDIESGKTLFATPVPPPVIIAALKGAKAAYKAGEHISKIIQDAIDYITDAIKDSDWNAEGLRKKLEALYGGEKKNSLDRYKDSLNRQIADLDRQIENRKRDNKKKNKTELDDEAKALVEKRDAKKKELEEVAPLSETEEYQLAQLEKFRKKLKGLSESQKDEVIRKSFAELIKNGALKQDDFRKIIAQATGRGDLTTEQSAKMKELVAHTNSVGAFEKRALDRRTDKSLDNYKKSQIRAARAARELSDMFDKKSDWLKVIAASVQGATLTATNIFILNPLYNFTNQIFVRLPNGALQSVAGIITGNKGMNTVFSMSTQKQFFKEMGKGLKESGVQLMTGMNRMDYDAKDIYTDQIRPMKSFRELAPKQWNKIARKFGFQEVEEDKKLTGSQKASRILQIFPGTMGELVFRFLNFGDKPVRFAAGGSTAAAFAREFGIDPKSTDWKIFLEFPREETYRLEKKRLLDKYKKEGLSDEKALTKAEKEAGEKADYNKESIIQEGKRSTLQQDNLFNDAVNFLFNGVSSKLGGAKDSGAMQLAKTVLVSPYIKIPSNAYWLYMTTTHPVLSVAEATGHLIASAYNRRAGNNVKAKLQLREARWYAANAAVGIALQAIVIPLIKAGIISAAGDDDDPKKEREGERTYQQQGTVDMNKLSAWLRGENPDTVKTSFDIPLKYYGIFGSMSGSIAREYENMTDEQRENSNMLVQNMLDMWDEHDLKELQNGIFSNTTGLLGSLAEGGASTNRLLINQINMFANLVHPAAVAQISRAQLPYYTTRKADSFAEELDNSLLERSSWYRNMKDKYPPTKYNIWGDPMEKDKSFIFRVLGFSRTNKDDNFAQPLFEDAKKYNDNGFFPPAIDDRVNGVKLTAEQYNDRQKFIGAARKFYFTPFANDGIKVPVVNKTYSELETPENKKIGVEYFSAAARIVGDSALVKKYPALQKKGKTINEETDEELLRIGLELMKLQTESKNK